MQWLPERENNTGLAVGLVVLVAVLVYLVGFHWFVVRHAEINRDMRQLTEQAARFKGAVARGPALEQQLQELLGGGDEQALFLPERNFNTAAARMTRRLRDLVREHSHHEGFCQVTATENRVDGEAERFEKVTVNVRMICPLDDFKRIAYALKNSAPLIFMDAVVIQQRANVTRRGERSRADGQLEIRFDMYGYRNQPPASDEA